MKKLFWKQHVVPMLIGNMSEEAAQSKVSSYCQAILDQFQTTDIVELDSPSASIHEESVSVATGILGILQLRSHGVEEDCCLTLHQRVGKTDKSIRAIVANAIAANPFLSSRLQMMIKALPTIAEYSDKVETWDEFLEDTSPVDIDGEVGLQE